TAAEEEGLGRRAGRGHQRLQPGLRASAGQLAGQPLVPGGAGGVGRAQELGAVSALDERELLRRPPGSAGTEEKREKEEAGHGSLPAVKLGEILVQEGHLTQEGLEEALDWQVLYGGRLGTNLLELRLVEEEQVARALGKQLGCEVAWGELQPQDEVVPLLPKHVADRDEMVPWKMEKR